jgi:hypothetical protein
LAQKDPATGAFVLAAVPPGSWKLDVRGQLSSRRNKNEEVPWGELPLEVGSADIENLKVPLNKLPDIQVLTSDASVGGSVQLHSTKGRMFFSTLDQRGESWIRGVEPGAYRVVVFGAGYCFASITAESQDLIREELVVSPGSSVPAIHFVTGDNCASLKLTVSAKSNCTGERCPGTPVVVTSDLKGFEPQMLQVSEGGYTLTGLHEGEYRVYAFDDADDLEYANPEALRNFNSQTVDLAAGQAAAVQLEVNERRKR